MGKGGKRNGAGRKRADPNGEERRPRTIYVTDAELAKIADMLAYDRQQAKERKGEEE